MMLCCVVICAQNVVSSVKNEGGDRIESTSLNDDKRGEQRAVQYIPEGEDFVCVNGKNRYTRALYGGHTAWRIETGDRPIFATFRKGAHRNIRLILHSKNGRSMALDSVSWCEAHYTPGRRSYRLHDSSWRKGDTLCIDVLASMREETGVWRISGRVPDDAAIEAILSPIRRPKLMRNGDMGVDPEWSFDPVDDKTVLQHLIIPFKSNQESYFEIRNDSLDTAATTELFSSMEHDRRGLAGRIRIVTPDPWLNTVGGAMAVAADGIWGEEGVWLHGAVGWRMPLSGWRAAYAGDALGWHDRARTHFNNYAASQVTDVEPSLPHPAQDSALALARAVKKWGTPMYSNGYICRNPKRNNQMHHYDMNLCYADELLWHLCWTGDLDYAKRMWPVLKRHLAWEKRNFDPDGDGLYDAYACIWASDALYYNGGAVTHSSAYNYRANRMAAMIAGLIGEDVMPYQTEADRILKAINSRLWIKKKGHWAEYQDLMGHKRLHEDAALWTIYHAIDSDVADAFQAYSAIGYVDKNIPHISVTAADGADSGDPSWDEKRRRACAEINKEGLATVSTTDWMPYSWSINNVVFAEVMHTALACFEAGRNETGYRLMKSSIIDGMYLGGSPANFGQLSHYDAARGECYRDFGDPIGVASRLLVQGLFGVIPDALNGRMTLRPGFPDKWRHASLHTPDIDFTFSDGNDSTTTYTIKHNINKVKEVSLLLPAHFSEIKAVNINGRNITWATVDDAIEHPALRLNMKVNAGDSTVIIIHWGGDSISAEAAKPVNKQGLTRKEGSYLFTKVRQGQMSWYAVSVEQDIKSGQHTVYEGGFKAVNAARCTMIDISDTFNADVKDVFKNKYMSPRPPYTTLQIPVQGIGEWCHPLQTAVIDDSGLRGKSRDGKIYTAAGVSFLTPHEGQNTAFTSLWDNYPDSISVKLKGRASHAYLLMTGTTNSMQSHIENGVVRVYYKDGSTSVMPLVNPYNWPPIEQLYFEDGAAFNRHVPALWRLDFKTGVASDSFGRDSDNKSVNLALQGGAAVMLDMPLDPDKKLSHLTVETLSNDVVIGLMAVTLQR